MLCERSACNEADGICNKLEYQPIYFRSFPPVIVIASQDNLLANVPLFKYIRAAAHRVGTPVIELFRVGELIYVFW